MFIMKNPIADITLLRTKMKADSALRTEVLEAVITVLGKHNILLEEQTIQTMTLCVDEELRVGLAHVIFDPFSSE